MNDLITPCLYFDGQAEEAANFYVSLFPNSTVDHVSRYGEGGFHPAGTAMMVGFTLDGRSFQAINGPAFERTTALSLAISCRDQTEVDRLWEALTTHGGSPGQCGWLTDKYGFAWQVVPARLAELAAKGGPGLDRMMAAMFGMQKLNMAALEAAYQGPAQPLAA